MTKTICDICGHKASTQYSVPCWSEIEKKEEIYRNTYYPTPHSTIKIIKIDLCEKCEKSFANFLITKLNCDGRGEFDAL